MKSFGYWLHSRSQSYAEHKSAFAVYAGGLAVVASVALPALWTLAVSAAEGFPTLTPRDEVVSPDGKFIVERIYRSFNDPDDSTNDGLLFAIRRRGQWFGSDDVFLTRNWYADYNQQLQLQSGIGDPDNIFARWIDNRNVLIAAPLGRVNEDMPSRFGNIHLTYGFYPPNPNEMSQSHMALFSQHEVSFAYKAGAEGWGDIACNLVAEADDGTDLAHIKVQFELNLKYKHVAHSADGIVIYPQHLDNDLSIEATEKVNPQGHYVTSAEVSGFSPEGHNAILGFGIGPKEGIGYTLQNVHDYLQMAELMRRGELKIKVAFWLENKQVTYTTKKPDRADAIEDFESCLKEKLFIK